MRLFTSVLASVAMLFVASSASAIVVFNASTSVDTGRALNALELGDLITIDIRVSKTDTTQLIFGLGGAVQGYNPSVVEFVSGVIYFEDDDLDPETPELQTEFFKLTATGVGLANLMPSGTLSQATVQGFGPYVQFANAAGTTGRRGNGSFDIGIDGTNASPEARIVFRVIGEGSTTFNIGTTTNPTVGNVVVLSGGVPTQAQNQDIAISVVPEPGTTLLMGLGLAGLASAGRRK